MGQELPRRLVALVIAAAVAVGLVYLLIVGTRWGQTLDERALLGREVISDLRADQADRFLRIVSGGTIGIAMALVTAVAFLRGRPWLALVAAGSIATAVIATELLKLVILERPDLIETTLNGGINSYPSGHTTVGMSVCFAAMLVVPARLRAGTALASGAIGAAFGVAVVAAGWHRPSDAIGSYLVCLSAASAAAALAYRYLPDRGEPREAVRSGASEMGLFGLGLALVAVFGVAALASRGVPIFSAGTGFLVASGALIAASFASAGLLAWAMSSAE